MKKIIVGLIPEKETKEVNYLAEIEYLDDKIDSARFPLVKGDEYKEFVEFEKFIYSFGEDVDCKVYLNLFKEIPEGLEAISGDDLMKLIKDNLITDKNTLASLFVIMAQGSKFKNYYGN